MNDEAIDMALAALDAVWEDNACPLCHVTMLLQFGDEAVGPCDSCVRDMLARCLATLKNERETCRELASGKDAAELISTLKRRVSSIASTAVANRAEADRVYDELCTRIAAAKKALEGIA